MPSSGRKSRNWARVLNIAQSICAPGSFRQKYQCPEGAFFTLESSPATHTISNWFSSTARTRRFSSATVRTGGAGGKRKPLLKDSSRIAKNAMLGQQETGALDDRKCRVGLA